jgi:hypothetical protein
MGMESVELVMDFEDTFGVRIPDQEAEKMVTPRHVIDWLCKKQSQGMLFSEPPLPQKQTWWRKLLSWPEPGSLRLKAKIFTRQEIAEQVCRIIADRVAVKEFSEDDRFIKDLRMD